jgi:hypothetical protein
MQVIYMEESDVRLEGRAYITHSLSFDRALYQEELEDLDERVQNLLTDVLQDWARSLPAQLVEVENGDDDDDDL